MPPSCFCYCCCYYCLFLFFSWKLCFLRIAILSGKSDPIGYLSYWALWGEHCARCFPSGSPVQTWDSRHGLCVASSVSLLARVIFCGFFFFGTDWISAVQKQATFTFTGVTEHWNRQLLGGCSGWPCLGTIASVREHWSCGTEDVKVVDSPRHEEILFQVLPQQQHLFVGREAGGDCQYTPSSYQPSFPCKAFPLLGVYAVISRGRGENICISKQPKYLQKMFAWEKKNLLSFRKWLLKQLLKHLWFLKVCYSWTVPNLNFRDQIGIQNFTNRMW